jgi:hypothetical protein
MRKMTSTYKILVVNPERDIYYRWEDDNKTYFKEVVYEGAKPISLRIWSSGGVF